MCNIHVVFEAMFEEKRRSNTSNNAVDYFVLLNGFRYSKKMENFIFRLKSALYKFYQ
jgi:hypothetical protein